MQRKNWGLGVGERVKVQVAWSIQTNCRLVDKYLYELVNSSFKISLSLNVSGGKNEGKIVEFAKIRHFFRLSEHLYQFSEGFFCH